MDTPLLVSDTWLSRKALLLKASFQDAVPLTKVSDKALTYSRALTVSGELMMTLSFLSTRLAPCDHKAQCTHALPSPEARPRAKPPGTLFSFSAFISSRKPAVSLGTSLKPAFSIMLWRKLITLPL